MSFRLVVSLVLVLALADSAKILVMVTIPSPSVFNLYTAIIEQLYERKHDITIQTIYPLKKPLPNAKLLMMKPSEYGNNEDMTKDFLFKMARASPISEVYSFALATDETCVEYFEDEATKKLLKEGKQFDLVITDGFSDCVLAAASMFGHRIVEVTAAANWPWAYNDVPAPPSYVPNYYRRMPDKMTFWQRLTNAIDIAAFQLIGHFFFTQSKTISKYLSKVPNMDEIRDNQVAVQLTIVDPVLHSPRPSMPGVINCGGLHVRDAQPLPKDLEDFVQSSGDDGFIILGLGTNMKSKFLPVETRDAILSAFSRLKQKVIWKFEADLENLPKNVKIVKWMPQQDLLGHPKIRLFITHSGLLSMQEAVYHGVPIIGMPFFMDQNGNIGRLEDLGIGEYLNFLNVTADGLYNLINKLLTDKSYRDNAKKYSAIYKDQPMKPLDKAIYWIEYALRHDGRHFRPASRDLNFIQYFLLDVIAFVLAVATAAIGIVVFVGKIIIRKVLSKSNGKKDFDKKQK